MANLTREYTQNTFDLLAFLNLQLAQLVVQFHDHHWLDEDGCATGRLIVYNAPHLSPILSLDGNNIAVAAYRNNGFLQRVPKFTDQCTQAVLQALIGPTDIEAQFPQCWAGRVQHLTLF